MSLRFPAYSTLTFLTFYLLKLLILFVAFTTQILLKVAHLRIFALTTYTLSDHVEMFLRAFSWGNNLCLWVLVMRSFLILTNAYNCLLRLKYIFYWLFEYLYLMSTNFIFYWRAIGLVLNSNSVWLSILTARPRNRLLFLDRILSLFTFGTRLRYARCYFLSSLSFLFRWLVHSSVIKIYRFLLLFHFLNILHVLL